MLIGAIKHPVGGTVVYSTSIRRVFSISIGDY